MISVAKDPVFKESAGIVTDNQYKKPWSTGVRRSWRMLNRDQRGMLVAALFIMLILPIAALGVQRQAINFSKADNPVVLTFGKAANLNGTSAYFDVPPLPQTLPVKLGFTFEAWIRPTQPVFDSYVVNKGDGTSEVFGLKVFSQLDQVSGNYQVNYEFKVADSSNGCSLVTASHNRSLSAAEANQITSWTHLAGVIGSDGRLELYVNGQKGTSGQIIGVCAASLPFQLGARKVNGIISGFFPGVIEEVRQSDVARYSDNFVPGQVPWELDGNTLALYHFDGNPSDYSSYGRHANDVGGVEYVDSTLVVIVPSPSPSASLQPSYEPSPTSLPLVSPSPTSAVPQILTGSLPQARTGKNYSTKIVGSQTVNLAPLAMSVDGLPTGINIGDCETKTNPNTATISCPITGVSNSVGGFSLTVRVTDSQGVVGEKQLTLNVR